MQGDGFVECGRLLLPSAAVRADAEGGAIELSWRVPPARIGSAVTSTSEEARAHRTIDDALVVGRVVGRGLLCAADFLGDRALSPPHVVV